MKAVLRIVSLLLALAIVAFVARTELRAPTVTGAAIVPDRTATATSGTRALQDKARDDTARALQDGARRIEAVER